MVPGWFCTPMTTISPSSTSSRRDDAVNRRRDVGLVELIAGAGLFGAALRDAPFGAVAALCGEATAASPPSTCAAAVSAVAVAVSRSDWAMSPACAQLAGALQRAFWRLRPRCAAAPDRPGGLDLVGAPRASDSRRAEAGGGLGAELAACTRSILRQHLPGLHAVAFLDVQTHQAAHALEPMSANRVATISPEAVTKERRSGSV